MKALQLFFLLLTTCDLHAQSAVIEFYNNEGKKTDEANSDYFMLAVKKDGFYVDSVFTHYTKTNALRSVETRDDRGRKKNVYLEYFENGNLKERSFYKEGLKSDTTETFYENGTPNSVLVHPEPSKHFGEVKEIRTLHYWDSTGTQTVKSGEGRCGCYAEWGSTYYREEGVMKDGYREGAWKGYRGNELEYEEEYSKGILKKGIRFSKGDKIKYEVNQEMAAYPGGVTALGNFIRQNLRYPVDAHRNGIQGKVFIAFIVKKNGELDDLKVVNDIPEILAREAIRVAKLMPPWDPGKIKGLPVNSRFVLPVNFKLER